MPTISRLGINAERAVGTLQRDAIGGNPLWIGDYSPCNCMTLWFIMRRSRLLAGAFAW